jgi:hypothetical protein
MSEMKRVWVLDTETKGTGAEMVPLEKLLERRTAPKRERITVIKRNPGGAAPELPKPRPPWRFRVVDVMRNQVLAESVDARTTVELLERFRSVVDVRLYVWEEEAGDWRPLTPTEKRRLWSFRGEPVAQPHDGRPLR